MEREVRNTTVGSLVLFFPSNKMARLTFLVVQEAAAKNFLSRKKNSQTAAVTCEESERRKDYYAHAQTGLL